MPVQIEEQSVGALRAGLDAGDYSVRDLVQASLDRITAMDHTGPALHAVIETNPDALDIADALDAELADGRSRGLLHGIPVLIKDNIATADRMQTTAGSLALEGATPRADAHAAARLREAGAVIIGKANLSEWANIRSSASTSGWSARGGQVRNPYQLDRNPSGSSSGSGAAVAASYVPLAVGTETNGSICSPASHCGVVGIKPTIGLVSRAGIIPISHRQDTAGPMARSVTDAAIMLNALAGDDPDDPAQREEAIPSPVTYPARPEGGLPRLDYTAFLDADGLQGARIGVWRTPLMNSVPAQRVLDESVAALAAAGAEVIDPVTLSVDGAAARDAAAWQILLWDLKADIAAYLRDYVDPAFPIRRLADIVAFNREHADRELQWFNQDLFEMALDKGSLDDPAYIDLAVRLQTISREEGIDAVMREHGLDAIVTPANAPATRIDLVNGDHRIGGSSTPSAMAGYPIVTVPAGEHAGLPLAVNFLGGAFSEPALIRIAYAFEQATQARTAPTYEPAGLVPPAATMPTASREAGIL